MTRRWRAFGLLIDSDRPIRGALTALSKDGAADLRIPWHDAADAPPTPVWTHEGDALLFAPPGVGHYRCTTGAIDIIPAPGADEEAVEALLVATALPAVLWLRHRFVLHAAAVVPAGWTGAIAIGGASGAGKSRLAATLLARGGALVADDSIAITGDAAPRCAGLAGGYHLGEAGAVARPFHAVALAASRDASPLAGVAILEDCAAPVRLHGVGAVATLMTHRHRASVPRLCGGEQLALEQAARLARAVPVYRWPRQEADALLGGALAAVMGERVE